MLDQKAKDFLPPEDYDKYCKIADEAIAFRSKLCDCSGHVDMIDKELSKATAILQRQVINDHEQKLIKERVEQAKKEKKLSEKLSLIKQKNVKKDETS